MTDTLKNQVFEILKHVYDPDYINRSIVGMGLVKQENIEIHDDKISVNYKVKVPLCPFITAIGAMIKYVLEKELKIPTEVKIEKGHPHEEVVNNILGDDEKYEELLDNLKKYGILERCLRV